MIVTFRGSEGRTHGDPSDAIASFALNCLRGREVRVVVRDQPMFTGTIHYADARSLVIGRCMMRWTIPFSVIVAVDI